MDVDAFLEYSGALRTLQVTLLVAGAPLIAALVVGVVMAILQAATQVQEQTLSVLPKLMAAGFAISLLGRWMFDLLRTNLVNAMEICLALGRLK